MKFMALVLATLGIDIGCSLDTTGLQNSRLSLEKIVDVSGVVASSVSPNDPIASASVQLADREAITDSTGQFYLAQITTGSQTLTVAKDGYQILTKTVDLAPDNGALGVLLLTPKEQSLKKFVDVSGMVASSVSPNNPIAGASVQLADRETITDNTGKFYLAQIAAGTQTITVAKEGFRALSKSIEIAPDKGALGVLRLIPNNKNGDPECLTSVTCPIGQICSNGRCEPNTICTPTSCSTGQFCDNLSGSCLTLAQKCQTSGSCVCHIANSAGQFVSAGTPTITLGGKQAVNVVVSLSTPAGELLPGAAFAFSITDSAIATYDNGKVLAGGTPGTTTLKATLLPDTTISCSANVQNLGTPTNTDLRVFVYDAGSGSPVQITTPGKIVVQCDGASTPQEIPGTTSSGIGVLANWDCPGTYTLTVFAKDYHYLSLVGLDGASAKDLVLPLRQRWSDPPVGGFDGIVDYTNYEKLVLDKQPRELKVGLVAGSFSLTSLLHFNINSFFGVSGLNCNAKPAPAGCYLLPAPFNTPVALPGGVVMTMGNYAIKRHFEVQTQPGLNTAWGIAGEFDINDIVSLAGFFSSCSCDVSDACESGCNCDNDCGVNFGQISKAISGLLPNFASGVVGSVAMNSSTLSDWNAYLSMQYPVRQLSSKFARLDGGKPYPALSVREAFRNVVDAAAPGLPKDPLVSDKTLPPGKTASPYFDTLVVAMGSNVQGRGIVPLGFGIGTDCSGSTCTYYKPADFDGKIDGMTICNPAKNNCPPGFGPNKTRVDDGHLAVFHAQPHSGLEDQPQITAVVAANASAYGLNFGERLTGFIVRDQPTASNLADGQFPEFPEFNAEQVACTSKYTVKSTSGIDAHWVSFVTPDNVNGISTHWDIYFLQGGGAFAPPTIPFAWANANPFLPSSNYSKVPNRAKKYVDVAHVGLEMAGSVTLSDMVQNLNGASLATLAEHVGGFSLHHAYIECP